MSVQTRAERPADVTFAENAIPPEVAANLDVLTAGDVWHLVSRNPPVRSCADAASRRKRLGGVGIPLRDELKSALGRIDAPGPARYVAFHIRGHQKLDEEKVAAILRAPFLRIDEQEVRERFGMGYGTVTPFALARHPEVTQIFDAGVIDRSFPPYTMMTNLGHLEWAVEFVPEQFLAVQANTRVEDVAAGARVTRARGQAIGILTGNSPEAGMLLWEKLNRGIRESRQIKFRGDVSFPRVLVESVPDMGLSMELLDRVDEVRATVTSAIERLCANGATVVSVACNTTQYFEAEIRKICAQHGVTYVSTAEETARYLRQEDVRSFDLFATASVADFTTFRDLAAEFEVNVPSPRHLDAIQQLAFSVKIEGVAGPTLNRMRDLVNQAARTDTVVLALTELSILFAAQKQRQKSSKRFIDTLDLVARRLAAIYEDDRSAHGVN
ncbi:aspartate/glutamate racemase family protein [Winogradskya humida]|uniref:YbaK/aminoacyl-tRNA synthetase-associated domain-containing protein n=1 Tax=Winogradskya humida TaxID=113566 RepID=A0ABQ4A2E2_9ACTN|nr:aspartate/glutamate racemase family protein [Actinoplanes humidus]GIE25018.1 hypothetical protein Ahu01nite_081200 [Actinoplanes humidus]